MGIKQDVEFDATETAQPVVSSSYLAAGLAVLLTAELAGLGAYIYIRAQTVLDPNRLADRVEVAIRENYPQFRAELVTRIEKKSPAVAQQVSAELLSAAPDARASLEQLTARQLDAGLEEATELSADQFRELLQNNREQVVKVFEKIEDAPEEARELVLETEAKIEEQLEIDLQKQARATLRVHRQLNDKLEQLADRDAALSTKELLERRIVRLVRSLQEEHLGQSRLTLKPVLE